MLFLQEGPRGKNQIRVSLTLTAPILDQHALPTEAATHSSPVIMSLL